MLCFTFKVAIYHDSVQSNVYVSLDEGRSWKLAEGVPEGKASMVIEHPFVNRFVNNISLHHPCGFWLIL